MGVFGPRPQALLAIAVFCLTACQAGKPTQGGASRRPTGGSAAAPSPGPRLVSGGEARPIAQGLQLQLSGAVRLISDAGGGIISNNSGALISNNSGSLISDAGGGIVSNNSGALISNHGAGFRLAQAEKTATESLLAEAVVQFFDAAGRPLADAKGQPLRATTDAQGRYALQATLPPGEPVVARVALYTGGELRAMVVPESGASGALPTPVDTASSLGASYVLERFVKGQVAVYQRLPAGEALALRQEAEIARARLGSLKPTYAPSEILALAEQLKAQDPVFSARLDRIEALLLAGQKDGGDGLPATQVAVSRPVAVWARPQAGQGFVFFEAIDGRRREVDAQGRLRSVAFSGTEKPNPALLQTGVPTADGGLLLLDGNGSRVLKLDPATGELKRVAGVGVRGQLGVGGPALQAQLLNPIAAAEAPDGSIWLGEEPFATVGVRPPARLLRVDPQGLLGEVPVPEAIRAQSSSGKLSVILVVALPDGALLVAFRVAGASAGDLANTSLWRWKAGQWESAPLWKGLFKEGLSASHLVQADGSVLMVATGANQLWRWKEGSSAPEVVGGDGPAGFAGDGGPVGQGRFSGPKGLAPLPGGGYLVADTGNGLVRMVDAQGRLSTVAGARGVVAVGEALTVALNGPGTPVVDPKGGLWVPELFSGTIKRLVGGQLEQVAGSAPGFGGDGGPALQAQFDGITSLARDPKSGTVYLTDGFNYRLRAIDAAGVVRTVAGNGTRVNQGATVGAAADSPASLVAATMGLLNPLSVAVDAQGRPWLTDAEAGFVWRIDADGVARRMGGEPAPDAVSGGFGGAFGLNEKLLSFPAGLALGPDGRMLMAEVAGMRLWREKADGTGMEPWAGGGLPKVLARAASGQMQDPDGTPLAEACFITPLCLAVSADGTIAVGEMGTSRAESLSGFLPIPIIPDAIPKLGPRIRLIRSDGTVDTLAGEGGRVLKALEGDDALGAPIGMVFDAEGRLVVADGSRNQLKLIPKAAITPWR